MKIKQIIPEEFCLKCEGCCRFIYEKSEWIPQITDSEILEAVKAGLAPRAFSKADKNSHRLNVIEEKGAIICNFLEQQTNKCKIYSLRPFDCRLYPFILEKKGNKVYLSLHLLCPFAKENINDEKFKEYIEYLKNFLKENAAASFIKKNYFLALNYEKFKDQIKTICELE